MTPASSESREGDLRIKRMTFGGDPYRKGRNISLEFGFAIYRAGVCIESGRGFMTQVTRDDAIVIAKRRLREGVHAPRPRRLR